MKERIYTEHAPSPIGVYSQGIRAGNTVYLSGQIALDPKTGQLVAEDFRREVIQVFKNMESVCFAAGGSLANIVKLTIYLMDLKHFSIVNEVMKTLFDEPYPARTTIQVSGLPKEAEIEIDAIMIIP